MCIRKTNIPVSTLDNLHSECKIEQIFMMTTTGDNHQLCSRLRKSLYIVERKCTKFKMR